MSTLESGIDKKPSQNNTGESRSKLLSVEFSPFFMPMSSKQFELWINDSDWNKGLIPIITFFSFK